MSWKAGFFPKTSCLGPKIKERMEKMVMKEPRKLTNESGIWPF